MSAECLVTVAEIEGRGRGLVSTHPLKAGQVVLKDSPILLYSAFPLIIQQNPSPSSSSYCQNCFKKLQSCSSLSTCASCTTYFCSPNCLSNSSHSPYVCQALTRFRNSPDLFLNHPLERQVQSRFLIAAYNLSVVSPSHFQNLLSVQGTPTSIDISAANFLHSLISSLCPPPSSPFPFSFELTTSLLAKDRLNAFGLMEPFHHDGQISVRAYGIYPKASLFNHDCLPNACRFDYVDTAMDNNTDIIVRIIHDVPQGREICLCYFPVNFDYSTRQKRLLEDYGFACDCDRCKVEANWSDNENSDENENENEEEEVMDEDEDQEMVASDNENGETNFPHAYFFVRYVCNQDNCWGTLAPLPPSYVNPSTIMECNVCGKLRNDAVEGEETYSMDD